MASQQFCLKWNNHQGNMISVFDDLLSTESFVDVTLACEGSSIRAHKVVLSACSPFFEELFKNNPCKHPIVIMKDMKYFDLKTIIQFMYKGEVNVSQDHLSALLRTAENLQVKGLAEVNAENQTSEDISSHKSQYHEEPKETPTSQSHSRRRPHSPVNQDSYKKNNVRMNTASPEIIEEVSAKQPRQQEPISTSQTLPKDISFGSNQSISHNYNRQTSFTEQFSGSHSYSPQNQASSSNYDKDTINNKNSVNQSEVNPEFSFLPVPSNINNEESENSFGMASDLEKDTKPPSSPQILPISIEKEVATRIKTPPSYEDYASYEGDSSQPAYDESSFQNPSVSLTEVPNESLSLDDMTAGPSHMIDSSMLQGNQSTGQWRQDESSTKVPCPECRKIYGSRTSMLNHYRHKHCDIGKIECQFCKRTYVWRNDLLRHLKNHPTCSKLYE